MGILATYHINPYTGVPGFCPAKEGQCPYGSHMKHYDAWEIAQSVADQIRADCFKEYEDIERQDRKREWDSLKTYDYLETLSDEDAIKVIQATNDVDLLSAIIDGQVLVRLQDDPQFVYEALRNQYLSDNKIQNMVQAPELYTQDALIALEDNPNLDSMARVELVRGYPQDTMFVEEILNNPGITKDVILEILADLKNENKAKWPPVVSRLSMNKNCPKSVFEEWLHDRRLNSMMNS